MVQTSPTPFDVGRAFVHQYYTLLHQAPHMLHRFYSTDSTFIHGGVDRPGCVEQPAVGPDNISQRINDLNLRDCHAKIRQVDSHPTIGDGVVVQVTGELSNNGDPMRRFMQTFVLAPRQPKKYYVQNDIFRYQDEVFDDGSDEVDEDDRSSSQIYGDTTSNADKTSNVTSSAAPVQQPLLVAATARPPIEEHQALPPRSAGSSLGGNQQQSSTAQPARQQENAHTGSANLNGFPNAVAGETNNYGGLDHGHLQAQQRDASKPYSQPSPRSSNQTSSQDNPPSSNGTNANSQPPAKQAQPTAATEVQKSEGKSYAGIAKLHQSAGSATNATSAPAPRSNPVSSGAPLSNSQQPNTVRPQMKAPSTVAPTNRPTNNAQPGQRQYPSQRGNPNYYQQNTRGASVATAPNEQQVFVGSLPLDCTEETLIECFSKYGTVIDAKIHQPLHDNKKNFGFVVFDNAESAIALITMAHVMYNDSIRLNVEPKTQRNYPLNNNGGNFNNMPQGGNRNSNYPARGGARGGNRTSYRGGGGNNPRRGGSQYNNNSPSFTGGDENNNSNDYQSNKTQQQQQQQPIQ